MMNNLLSKLHNIQDKDIIRKIGVYAFYLAVIVESLMVVVDKSRLVNPFEGRLFQITFALCVVKILTTKMNFRDYAVIVLFGILGLLTDRLTGRNELLRIFMFIAACKDMDCRKVLKIMFLITAIGCGIIVLLSITGIYGDISFVKEYSGEDVYVTNDIRWETRYCFGMGNANAFHCMFLVLTLLYLYLWKGKVRKWIYGVLFLLNIGIYMLTDSKLATGIGALSIIAMFIIDSKIPEKAKKVFSVIAIAADAVCVALAVFFAAVAQTVYNYDFAIDRGEFATFIGKLNYMLTGRIRTLIDNSVDDGAIQSWKLFSPPENVKYFDLGINRLFYWYGIIPAVVIILVFGALLIFLYRKKMYTEIIFLTMIICYTLIEAHFVSVYIGRCYPLIILGAVWSLMLRPANWGKSALKLDDKSLNEYN